MPIPALIRRLIKGSPLTKEDHDDNIDNFDQRILLIENGSLEPVSIDDFTVDENGMMTVLMTDYSERGPFELPTRTWRVRRDVNDGRWFPGTAYSADDMFVGPDGWLYVVLFSHTSAGSFDPNAVSGSDSLYEALLYGFSVHQVQNTAGGVEEEIDLDFTNVNTLLVCTADLTRIVIPKDATLDLPVSSEINVMLDEIGTIEFEPEDGAVEVSPPDGFDAIVSVRGAVAGIKKLAANRWRVYGHLTPS